jgi:hypothetical protein
MSANLYNLHNVYTCLSCAALITYSRKQVKDLKYKYMENTEINNPDSLENRISSKLLFKDSEFRTQHNHLSKSSYTVA